MYCTISWFSRIVHKLSRITELDGPQPIKGTRRRRRKRKMRRRGGGGGHESTFDSEEIGSC